MKNIRRLMAMMLAVVMVLGTMSLTVFAGNSSTQDAGSGSITVENALSDKTYNAYKIFDVAYADNAGTAFAYTIKSDSPWVSTVQTYAGTAGNGLTLTAVPGTNTTYSVTTTSSFSAAKFAAALKTAYDGMSTKPTATAVTYNPSTKKASASSLSLGYWFVTTTTGTLCNLTTTKPSATIYDKNIVDFEKTVDIGDHTVEVGQTVNFTITGKVPDATGYTGYTYTVEDEMTAGLTLNEDVKIVFSDGTTISVIVGTAAAGETAYAGTVPAAPTVTYTNGTAPQTKKKFSVTFDMTKWQAYKNQNIIITYSAKVNESASIRSVETNSATLTYSNDPASSASTGTITDTEKLYSFNVVIDKYVNGAISTKLSGAKFVLYKTVTDTSTTPATNTNYYYHYDTTNKQVSWVAESALSDGTHTGVEPNAATNITTIETSESGAAEFDGLKAGTYQLLETKAPDGYNLLTAAVPVVLTATPATGSDYALAATVGGKAATISNTDGNDVTAGIANSAGTELPSTGGIGTTIFYIAGAVLVIGALVLLIARKKANKDAE